MEYKLTVGLEVHAELKTKTKMFCSSKNDPDEERPNVNICPVCLAHPGTLPTINEEAVKHVLRVGLAVGGKLADFTEWDRKNYFYPDLPKGYQISQYKYPLISGGELLGVALTRIHLEEDTARSVHSSIRLGGLGAGDKGGGSLIDFNRAGVPLMELVTEPVVTSAKQAGDFARELQLLLRYLGVSEANMEKGEMRVEANISIAPEGSRGTKVEVKNLNSFRSVEGSIDYEFNRQRELLERGERVVQETRGWDENKNVTYSQREKESAHDYRYFPDPDLPKLKLSQIKDFANLTETLPELPWQKRARYLADYGLKASDVETIISDKRYYHFFDEVAQKLVKPELALLAANYLLTDLSRTTKDWPTVHDYVELVVMLSEGEISSRVAKDLIMAGLNKSPRLLAKEKGWLQESDESTLRDIVNQVIAKNPKVVADYQNGRKESLQFLVGQGMKLSQGAANPQVLKQLVEEILQ
ncbi:MAG: Asp-tRNA(Asn)/Glu-tRNA(Gln) amidotransferase subunit GatB [Patescibacteria group bacterium]